MGGGTPNAPRDPLIHIAIAAPTQPILWIPVYQSAAVVLFVPARSRAHILAQTLAPVYPRPAGNKDSGVRRSATAADDQDQRGKEHPNTRFYSGWIPGGRRGTCGLRDFTAHPTENFHLKNCAVREIFFKIRYIYTHNT